ncbi:hypothetical protein B481_0580 [Planococcus halocryophilus Or1]|nr:hypothetical protein B481_0580 [Planococcus halocryophilus Or1]
MTFPTSLFHAAKLIQFQVALPGAKEEFDLPTIPVERNDFFCGNLVWKVRH